MAFIKINDMLKKRGKEQVRLVPNAVGGARVKVLIGTCAHCAKLKDNTVTAMQALGMDQSDLEVISDLASIARMGVVATPSLIIDGRLVACGKNLSVEELKELLNKRYDK